MAKAVLGATYEKRKSGWWILWFCRKSGNVIEEQPIGGE